MLGERANPTPSWEVVRAVKTFGENMKALMAERGVSLRKLARTLNYDPGHLSKISNDKDRPSQHMAERLDQALDANGELAALRPSGFARQLNADDRERLARAIRKPSRVDVQVVESVAAVLAALRRLDDTLGPNAVLPGTLAQIKTMTALLREVRGPHRDAFAYVAAEFVQFAGWLYAEKRSDGPAVRLLTEAESMADEIGNGTLAAQAANFKGYVARQQGRPRGVVRHFLAAFHTPGAHPAQRLGDAVQAAQGYAQLGEKGEAHRLLNDAEALMEPAANELPPDTAYWLTPTFHRLNIGLAHLALGAHSDAADQLTAGFDGLPDDQRGADWALEYWRALDEAKTGA